MYGGNSREGIGTVKEHSSIIYLRSLLTPIRTIKRTITPAIMSDIPSIILRTSKAIPHNLAIELQLHEGIKISPSVINIIPRKSSVALLALLSVLSVTCACSILVFSGSIIHAAMSG